MEFSSLIHVLDKKQIYSVTKNEFFIIVNFNMCKNITTRQAVAYFTAFLFLSGHLQFVAMTQYRSAIRQYNKGNFKRYHQLIKIILNTGIKNNINITCRFTTYKRKNHKWVQVYINNIFLNFRELRCL